MTASIETAGKTRESWLEAAIEVFRPRFVEVGYPLPAKIHVGIGFPSGRAPENYVILAETVTKNASKDNVTHVYITPTASDPAEILRCLLHELVHVALDTADDERWAKHTHKFAEIATQLGFIGKMTETPVGPGLAFEFVVLADELGDFPHGAIDMSALRLPAAPKVPVPVGTPVHVGPRMSSGPLPQRNRYYVAVCHNDECAGANDYRVRMSRKWIDAGLPLCGLCGVRMEIAGDAD